MYALFIAVLLSLTFTLTLNAGDKMKHFYDFEATNIKGQIIPMSAYKGKIVLVVNVASKCSFTPQYEGLEKLYQTYHSKGLEILGFPCNQFGEQEPASEKEIQTFCKVNFDVTFPLFSKIDVNGDHTHPLYAFLKSEQSGFLGTKSIKWNFTKFLVDRSGNVLKRYGSSIKPKEIVEDIEMLTLLK